MLMLKKLTFAPIFLICFIILLSQIPSFLKSYDFIFSLSADTLIQLITVSFLITLSSLSFILFASFALEWKIILPVGILSSLFPFVFIEPAKGVVFMTGIIISLLLSYITLDNQMKSYLNFNPNSILGPSIKHLSTLLIIIISIVYFLSVNQIVAEKGFQIPDSLIESALKLTPLPKPTAGQPQTAQPQLSREQIDLLRQNPDLLKQSGLNPSILDTLNSPNSPKDQNTPNDAIKQTIKDQIQNLLKPYSGFIPVVLIVILFFTLQSLTSILNLLIYPLLWIIFYVLEKTNFIKFVTEQRPVKKMVI